MTPFTLRPSTFADYPALSELLKAAGNIHALSAAGLENMVRGVLAHPAKPHFFELVAEDAGRLVGVLTVWQNGGRFDPDRYEADVTVHPDVQGRGTGLRLAREAEAHLRARRARAVISGTYATDTRGLAFLARQGFTEQFRYLDNVLDLRDWDAEKWPLPTLPDGLRILTLDGLIRERGEDAAWHAFYDAFYDAFGEAREDVPSQLPASPMIYEVFRRRAEAPGYSPESVFLAVTAAGEVAALSELKTDPQDAGLLHNGLTGTRRAWRRGGLALALKLAGLHWAQERGARRIHTGNATSNAPMLANEALGFQPEKV